MNLQIKRNIYSRLDLGSLTMSRSDHVFVKDNDKLSVLCHILDKKRMKELEVTYSRKVSFVPHPFFLLRSDISKSKEKICLLLIPKSAPITEDIREMYSFLAKKGYSIKRASADLLTPQKLIRAYKESEFVICCYSSDEFNQISLCGSGTPFVLYKCTENAVVDNFLFLANIKEARMNDKSINIFKEIEHNKEMFTSLVKETIVRMDKFIQLHSQSLLVDEEEVPENIFFSGKAVLHPWKCRTNDINLLNCVHFVSSLPLCESVTTSNPELKRLLENLGVVVKFVNTEKPEKFTVTFLGTNGVVVHADLETLKGEVVSRSEFRPEKIKDNEVLILNSIEDTANYKHLISLVRKDYVEEGRPLTYTGKVPTPEQAKKLINERSIKELKDYLNK